MLLLQDLRFRDPSRDLAAEEEDRAAAELSRVAAFHSAGAAAAAQDAEMAASRAAAYRGSTYAPTLSSPASPVLPVAASAAPTLPAAPALATSPVRGSPNKSALDSSLFHREQAAEHERAAEREKTMGNFSLASLREEQAALQYKRAADLDLAWGNATGARINAEHATAAESRSVLSRDRAVTTSMGQTSPDSRMREDRAAQHQRDAMLAAQQGCNYAAATKEEQAAAEFLEAAKVNEVTGNFAARQKNLLDAELSSKKAMHHRQVARESLSPTAQRLFQ